MEKQSSPVLASRLLFFESPVCLTYHVSPENIAHKNIPKKLPSIKNTIMNKPVFYKLNCTIYSIFLIVIMIPCLNLLLFFKILILVQKQTL